MALDTFNPYLFVSAGEQSNKYLTPTYAGGIAKFQTQRAQQLTGLTVQFGPIQEGTGDPAPDNIRPISGRTGLTVKVAGKNLFNEADAEQTISTDRYAVIENGLLHYKNDGTNWMYTKAVPVYLKAGTYILSLQNYRLISGNAPIWMIKAYGQTYYPTALTPYVLSITEDTTVEIRLTTNNTTAAAEFYGNIQLERGSTATSYEPYHGTTYPISWDTEAGTVYGGTLDLVSGVLTVDWDYIASYNGETLPGEWISDRDVYAEDTTPTTGAEVAYKLAEPVTYQLDPENVMTVPGFNQAYSNAGAVIGIQF